MKLNSKSQAQSGPQDLNGQDFASNINQQQQTLSNEAPNDQTQEGGNILLDADAQANKLAEITK